MSNQSHQHPPPPPPQPDAATALIGMSSTHADENRLIYDTWAPNYERDVQQWGYQTPHHVATLLAQYLDDAPTTKILDAGAGDGLSGVALRQAGFCNATIVGADLSPAMLNIAAARRNCYNKLCELNLNVTPYPSTLAVVNGPGTTTATDTTTTATTATKKDIDNAPPPESSTQAVSLLFDAITCVGTMTYVDPPAALPELCRWVKPGGFICYTNRTDRLERWRPHEQQLERDQVWKLVDQVGPLPYLPHHQDFGNDIQVVIFLYQKL